MPGLCRLEACGDSSSFKVWITVLQLQRVFFHCPFGSCFSFIDAGAFGRTNGDGTLANSNLVRALEMEPSTFQKILHCQGQSTWALNPVCLWQMRPFPCGDPHGSLSWIQHLQMEQALQQQTLRARLNVENTWHASGSCNTMSLLSDLKCRGIGLFQSDLCPSQLPEEYIRGPYNWPYAGERGWCDGGCPEDGKQQCSIRSNPCGEIFVYFFSAQFAVTWQDQVVLLKLQP